MRDKEVLVLLVCAVYGLLLWMVYLMLARPLMFFDWFIRRTYRSWGISVVVENEKKLRKRSRTLGLLMLVFVMVHATVVIGAILKSCQRG